VPSNRFWIQRFSLVSEMYMYSTPIVPQYVFFTAATMSRSFIGAALAPCQEPAENSRSMSPSASP
jgi:hypothetical protein